MKKQKDDIEKHRILKARAEVLAKENKIDNENVEMIEFTEFIISNERYGIENSFIREVYPLKEYTPLPGAPDFVIGIINVRGKITSVIDIRKFFDLPSKGISDLNKVVIVHSDFMEFGILAEVVVGVHSHPISELHHALPLLTDVRVDYFKGVTLDCLVILDIEKLLNDKKIIVQEGV